jgi:hypothetical protein
MTLKLTRTLADTMSSPSRDIVYSPHSLCTVNGDEASWTHPDDQYVIVFDRRTRIFTGHYYDWNEETQEWVDTDPMTADQIRDCIARNHLIFAS